MNRIDLLAVSQRRNAILVIGFANWYCLEFAGRQRIKMILVALGHTCLGLVLFKFAALLTALSLNSLFRSIYMRLVSEAALGCIRLLSLWNIIMLIELAYHLVFLLVLIILF